MDTADSVNNLKIWDKNPNSSLPKGTSRFHFLINEAEIKLEKNQFRLVKKCLSQAMIYEHSHINVSKGDKLDWFWGTQT